MRTYVATPASWDESQVERCLVWYKKAPSDTLIGEENLRGITIAELNVLFGSPNDDPALFNPQPLSAEQKSEIQNAVEHRIEPNRFDYFVEARQLGS